MLEAKNQGPRTQAQVLSEKKKKKVFTKIFQAISTKKRFSRTWDLEAKAKDLTFEAKDFKMCPRGRPRGQGRPRGLHHW